MNSSEAEPAGDSVRRLFFALWPEEIVRDRLQEVAVALRSHCAARWVKRENFHITLCFLGPVPESGRVRLGWLEWKWPAVFDLSLDELRFVPRRQMIWLVPSNPPDALRGLSDVLNGGLEVCGLMRDMRPLHAHLTLARKASRCPSAPLSVLPVRWTVRSVELVESVSDHSGVRYRVLNRWPLQAMPPRGSVE